MAHRGEEHEVGGEHEDEEQEHEDADGPAHAGVDGEGMGEPVVDEGETDEAGDAAEFGRVARALGAVEGEEEGGERKEGEGSELEAEGVGEAEEEERAGGVSSGPSHGRAQNKREFTTETQRHREDETLMGWIFSVSLCLCGRKQMESLIYFGLAPIF